jgi:hypothetical protein
MDVILRSPRAHERDTLTTVSRNISMLPVLVEASPADAGQEMLGLLADEYGAVGELDGEKWRISITPIDDVRRGTIIYRVIQASRAVDAYHPESRLYLITEDGNRWRLPPPSL